MHLISTVLAVAGLLSSVQSFSIPPNVQKFYNAHKSATCAKPLASGFQPYFQGSDHSSQYCGDVPGLIYGHSTAKGGQYWDMDIDCDGANRQAGKCANDPTGQSQTAFQDQVRAISGLEDLDANVHPYVVFGNEESSPSFNPQGKGMKPLSVMAVVCNNQLWYGIWGDTNGGTTTGEASISLGELCFPNEGLSGDNGHDAQDVLYIGFTSGNTAPTGANWKAGSALEFSNSIKAVGDRLVAGL